MSGGTADALAEALAVVREHAAHDPAVVSARGLEALVAGVAVGAGKKAWLLPGRRERACALVRGCPPDRIDAARPYRVVPPGASPVARAAQAVGMALAGDPAVVFLGTGSVAYGDFAEALAAAVTHAAPVTFVVSWYTTKGPFATQLPGGPAALAASLGLATAVVDAADAAAVAKAVKGLLGKPGLVEARLAGNG